jgi:hypothetical protein
MKIIWCLADARGLIEGAHEIRIHSSWEIISLIGKIFEYIPSRYGIP